jgi:hypothetical protein
VGQVDDRGHDRRVLLVGEQAGHERPVDLELVDREPLEVRQRGVAGAEVVDRQADPEALQLGQGGAGGLDVLHQHRLGDLQVHGGRVDAGLGEDLGHHPGEVGVGELAAGQVHLDPQA